MIEQTVAVPEEVIQEIAESNIALSTTKPSSSLSRHPAPVVHVSAPTHTNTVVLEQFFTMAVRILLSSAVMRSEPPVPQLAWAVT